MNWGKGITIALICFMGFIVYLATSMMLTKVDLESDDYYIREIAYDEEIEALKNGFEIEKIAFNQHDDVLSISIPDQVEISNVQIDLQRPNNDELDKVYNFEDSKTLIIGKEDLEKGNYDVEVTFKSGDKICLQKSQINIQ